MLHGRPYIRNGLCTKCGRTTPHAHTATGWLWRLHVVTFQVLPRLGIGQWACVECYNTCALLRRPSGSGRDVQGESEFASDGNFISGDFSLVRKSLKNSRYTQKFRDSVVDRLLTDQTNMQTIRSELRIRESDLLAWIADRVRRQQERIAQLSSLLHIIAGQKNDLRLGSESTLEDENDPEPATVVDHPAEHGTRKPVV